MVQELRLGVGVVLLTEEVIFDPDISLFLDSLERQPSWSDLPVILMVKGGVQSPAATNVLRALRNVTLMERPAPMRSIVSVVQAALRARERQYQSREQFFAIAAAETQARELRERLQIALEASDLGTFHCEIPLEKKITWNARCKAHFWMRPDEEINLHKFYEVLHPEDRDPVRQAIDVCVNYGAPYDIEYRTVSPSGEIRWVRATGRTYYDTRRNPICFDGTTQDITSMRQKALSQTGTPGQRTGSSVGGGAGQPHEGRVPGDSQSRIANSIECHFWLDPTVEDDQKRSCHNRRRDRRH